MLILILLGVIVVVGVIVAGLIPFDSENYKKCQHCKRKVKIETVVCKYCKKDLVELPYRKNEH